MENGLGTFDTKIKNRIYDVERINFLRDHIQATLRARASGINIIGYTIWTYCDIFSPSGGYRKKYGLVEVDFNSSEYKRTPKLSYTWMKQVIKSKGKNLNINLEELKQKLETDIRICNQYYK
jgi:6-phospho-beta-glucosidase